MGSSSAGEEIPDSHAPTISDLVWRSRFAGYWWLHNIRYRAQQVGAGVVLLPCEIQPHAPSARGGDRHAPANTLGIRRVALSVDDIDAVVAGLRARGTELVGELVRYEDSYRLCYEDSYRLCYVRGPEGIIVMLAERIG